MEETLNPLMETHGLSPEDVESIRKLLKREPDTLTLGVFGLNWSEHCSYKSSKRYLKLLPSESHRVIEGPGENAGVVSLKGDWAVVFKVESHNHPSAVEPFHGAATGIGGIIRDIISMGARPIALLDSLHFGPLEEKRGKWLIEGVVGGISFYGNCIGVPTVGGEVQFETPYNENPLVNVMAVGIAKRKDLKRSIAEGIGNPVILVGALTGRDGIHGATFASEDLEGDMEKKRPNVQIGDPFWGKLLIESIMEAIKLDGLIGLQDLGAGGLSTALPEMAQKGGVGIRVDLSRVPVRTPNLTPYEILLSESQERMVLCVEKGKEEDFLSIFGKWGLNASIIGKVIKEQVFEVSWGEKLLTQIPLSALQKIPERELGFIRPREPGPISIENIPEVAWDKILLGLLQSPNVGSRNFVYEQYDYTVQANTVLLPGQTDAALIRVWGEKFGIAFTIDSDGRLSNLSPRKAARRIVTEAAENIVSIGALPIGITDCLNFGNPEDRETYGSFIETIYGLKEASEALGIPIVSGNVSFYNQTDKSKVYPTPVVGMVGILEDVSGYLNAGFKDEGDLILTVGRENGEIGGSEFLHLLGVEDGKIEDVDLIFETRLLGTLLRAHQLGILKSAHNVSRGGLLVAVAESVILGKFGASLSIKDRDLALLFGEIPSRFIVSAPKDSLKELSKLLSSFRIPYKIIGEVGGESLSLFGTNVDIGDLKKAYNSAIKRFFS